MLSESAGTGQLHSGTKNLKNNGIYACFDILEKHNILVFVLRLMVIL